MFHNVIYLPSDKRLKRGENSEAAVLHTAMRGPSSNKMPAEVFCQLTNWFDRQVVSKIGEETHGCREAHTLSRPMCLPPGTPIRNSSVMLRSATLRQSKCLSKVRRTTGACIPPPAVAETLAASKHTRVASKVTLHTCRSVPTNQLRHRESCDL